MLQRQLVYEATSQINEALAANLKALEFANKAGSQWTLAIAYSNFVILYSMLEDLEHAEHYYSLLTEMPKEVVSNTFVRIGRHVKLYCHLQKNNTTKPQI